MTLALRKDAGFDKEDDIIGSLAICTTNFNDEKLKCRNQSFLGVIWLDSAVSTSKRYINNLQFTMEPQAIMG